MTLAANDAEPQRAVCAVMRIETQPGRDDEFAALMTDLAFQVRSEEPGCSSYVVTRAMGSREHFAIHAQFENWAAFEEHAETPHLDRLLPRLTALLASPVAMEIFLAV
jgi:quinol monooxygenase YgiN